MTNFYQSPSDKARFDVLLKVLSEEGPNLAIIGDDEVALAHYGRTIYQRLSQLPNAQVDLWGAIDSEKLVNRFNDILSELTLEQAQDKSQRAPVRRCFIITDAHAVQTLELQLLSRLIQGFPASHVHAVLLIHRNEPYQKKLEVFGKSLLRWELESEHPTPARMQRIETRDVESSAAAVTPMASTASVLGARQASRAAAGAGAAAAATASSAAPQSPEPLVQPAPSVPPSSLPEFDVSVTGDQAPVTASVAASTPARGGRLGWGLLLALLIALTVLAAMNLDRISQELEQLERYVSGKKAAGSNADADATGQPSARLTMSSTTQLPVKPDDSLIPDKESIVASAATVSATDAAVAAAAPPATTTPPTTPAPTVAAQAVTPPTPAPAPSNASPAPAADKNPLLAESRQWVRDLPSNGWVLQHAALDTLDEAKTAKGAANLQDARILMTQRKAKGYYYIVVTGPYASRAAAQEQMKRNPSWAKAWLRGPKSMQQQFED